MAACRAYWILTAVVRRKAFSNADPIVAITSGARVMLQRA
jgi:hypothetical protein